MPKRVEPAPSAARPEPEPEPEPKRETPPAGALANLSGVVRTLRPNGRQPYGVPWGNIVRYAPLFEAAGKEFGVDPALMAAMAIVESDGDQEIGGRVVSRDDGLGDGASVGILQVKPRLWQPLVPDADAKTAAGNIRLGTAIMGQAIRQHGTWQRALTRVYFPQDDRNGTTQSAYVQAVAALLAEIKGITPAPQPQPQPDIDPIRVIVGGKPYTVISGFGDPSDLGYYDYGRSHGAIFDRCGGKCHTGLDVTGTLGQTLYTPAAGVVTCAGTGNGPGSWGTGCAAFPDYFGNRAGRVEILFDSGLSMILGHCSEALVKPGQRVTAGQAVARMGGMNSVHTHLECRIWKNDGRCS
jgi:murein DD-endopeptidase MepM/ murein hydrolase activator NlpD